MDAHFFDVYENSFAAFAAVSSASLGETMLSRGKLKPVFWLCLTSP